MQYASGKPVNKFQKVVTEILVCIAIVFVVRTIGFGLYQVPTGSMETSILVGERFFADKFTYLWRAPARGEVIAFNDPCYPYSSHPLKRLWENYVWGPGNWTKRVIGIPGDIIKGAVENGKPVVYRNGQKIDESYVNKYPLIALYKGDPAQIRARVELEIAQYASRKMIDPLKIDQIIQDYMDAFLEWRSYDPSVSFEDQPFYKINPARIARDSLGAIRLRKPGTPLERDPHVASHNDGTNRWNGTDEFYVELGPDQYWLMGDNRLGSQDSRFLGPVSGKLIHGKIVFRLWSNDSSEQWWLLDLIRHPINFWQKMRWSRFLNWVK